MPPKKTKSKQTSEQNGEDNKVPAKRKANSPGPPSKQPRRSARTTPKQPTSTPDAIQVLTFLLSPLSLPLASPKDETTFLEENPKVKTFASLTLTPFETLLSAVVLSRPISHALGVRSIRTLLNEPYVFTTPKKIQAAGRDDVREALEAARTQHRQKTADELVGLAESVLHKLGDGDEDVDLQKVRHDCKNDASKERDMLQKAIKGVGKTGLDIFCRRIQSVWDEVYPFADQRTCAALVKLGLPDTAKGLATLIDEHWDDLKQEGTQDTTEEKRKAFVHILERAVGADLEGNVQQVLIEAEKSTSTY